MLWLMLPTVFVAAPFIAFVAQMATNVHGGGEREEEGEDACGVHAGAINASDGMMLSTARDSKGASEHLLKPLLLRPSNLSRCSNFTSPASTSLH